MTAFTINGVAITESNRFSAFCRKKSDLDSWVEHFKAGGIRVAVVLTDAGYALYREGMADIVDEVED